jgi:hypothetical protein
MFIFKIFVETRFGKYVMCTCTLQAVFLLRVPLKTEIFSGAFM